jgi:hypothetical protein
VDCDTPKDTPVPYFTILLLCIVYIYNMW